MQPEEYFLDRRARQVSAVHPDWSRERKSFWTWHPAASLIATLRGYERWSQRRGPVAALMCKMTVLRHRFWSIVSGADIPLCTQIGGGLLLIHPNGIVIHPQATIGPNCLIFHQVTIGALGSGGAPRIGGHVDIGAGAKILGNIKIGDHAKIGANAVVLENVPQYATAVGVPARIIGTPELAGSKSQAVIQRESH